MKRNKIINEKALVSLIKSDYRRIVNVFEDHLQFCNGYLMVNLDYENYSVIQALFKTGALTDFRKLIPTESRDISEFDTAKNEVQAKMTSFIKEDKFGRNTVRIFEIEGNYYTFNKKLVDIFGEVSYKAERINDGDLYQLRVYDNDKFIGLILPLRMDSNKNIEKVINNLVEANNE